VRILWLIALVTQLIWSVSCGAVRAEEADSPRQIWMIIINGLTLSDLREESLPHFRALLERGAVAGMNLKTGKREWDAHIYATMGAGTRISAPTDATFYQTGERIDGELAGDRYAMRTGLIPPDRAVVYPAVHRYIRENEAGNYRMSPGALGEALRRAGRSTAVLGNLDEGETAVRWAPFLTMDARGITPVGSIGRETLLVDSRRPFGVKTNYSYLLDCLKKWKAPSLVVVELGDLYRLDRISAEMATDRYRAVRLEVLKEMDRFLGRVMALLTPERQLVLVSPGSSADPGGKEVLAPLIWYRPGGERGLLYSPTTRREGLVSNVDLAPTVLDAFGIPLPDPMLGRPMRVVDGSIDEFFREMERVHTIYGMRASVISAFIVFQIAVLLSSLVILWRRWHRFWEAIQGLLIAMLVLPFLLLLISGASIPHTWGFLLTVGTLALFLTAALRRLPVVPLLLALGILGCVPVVLDGIFGGTLIEKSFLGYDPIKGARYYGIGNEYMGIVLGSAILSCAAWLERRQGGSRLPVALFFLALVFFFAAPFWGTNAGGALASAVGFGTAYFRFFRRNQKEKWYWIALVFLFLGAGLLIGVNLLFDDQPSHIGRALSYLMAGDVDEIAHIIMRKLEVNLRLLRVSSWGKVLLTSLFVLTLISYRPFRGLKWMKEHYPKLYNGFASIGAGALAALALNDSGLVSAATAIIYAVVPFLIIAFREWSVAKEGRGG
jgi:hypothetical protein